MTPVSDQRGSRLLLVLDVMRFRIQQQHFRRRENRIAQLGVVVKEELEPSELHWLRLDVGAVRIVLEPGLAPPVHVDHDLNPRVEPDLLRSREHVVREPVHDENLGRKIVLLHQVRQQTDGVIHVIRAHGPNPRAWLGGYYGVLLPIHPRLHREFGIEPEHHIRSLQKWNQAWQLFLYRALTYLNIEEDQGISRGGPGCHLLDESVGHAETVLPITS